MATGTFRDQALPPPPPVAEGREHARVIQRQLGRTSLHVRLVDLASGIAVWLIGVVLFFLLAALIDHTLGLGTLGRAVGLALLVAGSVYYIAAVLGPLLWKSINPAYAARTIEDATPSLKNSLINFLLLRQDRAGVKELVFEALERKAASDIAGVPVEATVDRSRLIRAGYVLCGVMAIFAAYKILSPKDPFQTAARVALPWADIARPSRVTISDVQPGHAEVYHGQTVTISAAIDGVREEDAVALRFSTEDGQTVDRTVAMKSVAGGRYECTLPPPDDALVATAGGLQQDVTYRLTAGDAETSAYELRVVAAPTIVVDRLEYQYPAYTKKPAETVAQQGDIRALEGTKVTIRAIANQPIKSAWIEFDPETKSGVPETAPLAAEGTRAWGTITLQLKDDRRAPWHSAYQVRFYNERQQRSQQPILHRIEVIRDLPPEVQILQPERLRIEVPENGQQTIEVRGIDPDFGLSRLAIEGTAGQKTVKVDLLDPDKANVPQAVVTHAFRPREHELVAGDELVYVAVAEDNRTDPLTGEPAANVARTTEYTLVILPPQAGQQGQAGDQGQEGQPGQAGQQNQPPMNGQDQPQQGQNQQDPQARSASEGQEPMPGQNQQGEPQQGQQQQGENQQGQGEQQGQQQKGGKGEQGQNQQGEQQGQQQGEAQASPYGSGGSQSPSSASAENMGEGAQSGGSGGASQRGAPQQGSPMGDNPDPAATGQGNTSGQSSGNSQQPSGQQGEESGDASGQPSGAGGQRGKAHDGEAIEQVIKELEQKSQSPEQGDPSQTPTRSVSEGNQQGDASADEGSQNQPMPNQANQGQGGNQDQSSSSQPGSEQGNPPQSAGKSGTQGQNTPSTGTPAGNDQKPDPAGQDQKSAQGQNDKGAKGEKGQGQDRLPEEQQGQNPSEQPGGENEGGAPKGPSTTDKGQESDKSKGEERDAGAGQNGDEGAGSASDDKSGSGQGQRENRDRNKEQKADSSRPEKGDVSGVSNSKKQSDSKGGASGDESGGGKQGAGQSAGQEGNDSAGSKSAADQGAGKASETGSGETGSKAGEQDQAAGQTGKSGQDKGAGSSSRGDKGDKSGQGEPGEAGDAPRDPSEGATDKTGKKGRGAGPVVGGGADGDREKIDYGPQAEAQPGDEANLEYARKATEMALQHLRDQEQQPDPELLDKLGWSREDLAEFLRRWEALEKSAETPEGQRELDEALKSLGLRDPANRKRAGGTASDDQRGLRDGGNRTAPPPKYRDLFDAFRKGAARSGAGF